MADVRRMMRGYRKVQRAAASSWSLGVTTDDGDNVRKFGLTLAEHNAVADALKRCGKYTALADIADCLNHPNRWLA